MFHQLYIYMNNFLNELLCGFRKAHSTQHALFKLLQAWPKELDNSEFIGTILMNLSKAYDCLPHDLLVAKLGAYGLDRTSLSLTSLYSSIKLISVCNEQRLVYPTATGLKLRMEFLNTPYWYLY